MTYTKDSEILIVGGGLAGVTLANYLSLQGHKPLIIEQATQWRGSGYGIGLWETGFAVLAELGLFETARKYAADPDGFEVRSSADGVLTRTTLPAEQTLLLAIYRGDLHATLREGIPSDWIRMGTTPKRIVEQSDAVEVTFDDGTTEAFSLVVGADGVHSTVRNQCFDNWTLREYNTYIWSLWASQDMDLGSDMVSVWGPGSEGFVAHVGDCIGFNLAARLDTPPEPPACDELRTQAERIGWPLPALLDGTDDDPFFDRVRDVSCERWHTDRIVLIGDAAHAVHPISGMGASLALQDARVLAQELATGSPGRFSEVLPRFEKRRRGDATRVAREAQFEAAMMFLESKYLRKIRDSVVKHTPLFDLFIKRRAIEREALNVGSSHRIQDT